MRCLLRGLLRVPLSRLRTLRSSIASDANKSELQGINIDMPIEHVPNKASNEEVRTRSNFYLSPLLLSPGLRSRSAHACGLH